MKSTIPIVIMTPTHIIDHPKTSTPAVLAVEPYPTPQIIDPDDPAASLAVVGKDLVAVTVSVAVRGYGVDERIRIVIPRHDLEVALQNTCLAELALQNTHVTEPEIVERCSECTQPIDFNDPNGRQHGYGFVCGSCAKLGVT